MPKPDRSIFDEVSKWLIARDGDGEGTKPNPKLAAQYEKKIHALLKAKWSGYGFDFAGLICFVDKGTPDGKVETMETFHVC